MEVSFTEVLETYLSKDQPTFPKFHHFPSLISKEIGPEIDNNEKMT